jgi:TolA-binding protein
VRGQKEEADRKLVAAMQDSEKQQQQMQGEIGELQLRCLRLEEQLRASDREHDRLRQENVRLLAHQILSPQRPNHIESAISAPETTEKGSTEKEQERERYPDAPAVPVLGLSLL